MDQSTVDYQHLHMVSRHAELLRSVSSLLEWDHETYMPADGDQIRSEQIKILAGLLHEERTGNKFIDALQNLIDIKSGNLLAQGLSEPQVAALKRWRRDYIQESALPKQFVEEFAQLTSQAQSVWRKARAEQSFEQFAPFLDKIIIMCRKKADLLTYIEHPYDALLDLYEPEVTTRQVSELFSSLEKKLSPLLKKIAATKQIDDSFLCGNFDPTKQLEFSKLLLNGMGYDQAKGRLDLSTHPFSTSLHPYDCRITTRIDPTSVMSNIGSVLHEAGHALYEMGLPVDAYGSPLCQAISHGMHESQSRWWETLIGQSTAFWASYLPQLQKVFPDALGGVSLDRFYQGLNKVQPSLIRVEADEVSYPLHIIVRFQIERALIEGSMSAREIPEMWNAKMKELLGVTPQNNSEGCLQDVHWSIGAFGYFPSYTLGNLYAAQLFLAFEKEHPNWKEQLATGELLFIKTWLNNNVHRYGRQYSPVELLEKVTKSPFSSEPYTNYLTKKYSEIYKLNG